MLRLFFFSGEEEGGAQFGQRMSQLPQLPCKTISQRSQLSSLKGVHGVMNEPVHSVFGPLV